MGPDLDRIGSLLVNRELFFSDPQNFNDPFDCALGVDFGKEATDDEWTEYFEHVLEIDEPESTPEDRRGKAIANVKRDRHRDSSFLSETESGIAQQVTGIGRQQGVLCLTSDPKNILMWAHYANDHKGLVLGFDTQRLLDMKTGEFRGSKIDYKPEFPRLSDYLEAVRKMKQGRDEAMFDLFYCRKHRDWEYEKEWRFFSRAPNTTVGFDPRGLMEIIFGWKMSEKSRRVIMKLVEGYGPQLTFMEALPCPNRFAMETQNYTCRA